MIEVPESNQTVSTAEIIQGRPVTNETSEGIQLESTTTSSTTSSEETIANATSDEDNSTTSSTDVPVAVSENNQSETTPSEVDRSQEGLPLNSAMPVNMAMASMIFSSAVASWLMH